MTTRIQLIQYHKPCPSGTPSIDAATIYYHRLGNGERCTHSNKKKTNNKKYRMARIAISSRFTGTRPP